ncbi:hypothetical protein D3C71_1642330 [compost metagenome]
MEGAIAFGHGDQVAGGCGVVHLVYGGLQARQSGLRDHAGGQRGREFLEFVADQVDVAQRIAPLKAPAAIGAAQALLAGVGDEHAASGFAAQQPQAFQHRDRFAQRGAAHAQRFGQLALTGQFAGLGPFGLTDAGLQLLGDVFNGIHCGSSKQSPGSRGLILWSPRPAHFVRPR